MNHREFAPPLCRRLEGVQPKAAVRGGRMDVLIGSPECTHHSNARGGMPMSDQSRAGGMLFLDWASQLYISRLGLENVVEWEDWGPLGADGRPLKSRKGESFRALVDGLFRIGYKRIEWEVLDSADFGAATSRKRLFLQAARTGKILWPKPTHAEDGRGGLMPWRCWTEIIDWRIRGTLLSQRERPLSEKTMVRIYDGLARCGLQPFVLPKYANNRPLGGGVPLGTLATEGAPALVNPFLVEITHAGKRRPKLPGEPLPTLTTANRGELALCRPFLLPQQSGGALRPMGGPMPTIATDGAIALLKPFLVQYYGTQKKATMPGRPMPVATTTDRFGVALPVVKIEGRRYQVDVEYRMLQPCELAAGMGFPASYKLAGSKTEQIKQIGNAVECHVAEAVCGALLDGMSA